MQHLLLIKEDCFDKLLTLPLMNLSTYPQLCQLEIQCMKNDHSLNVLDFHMNKVSTLLNAWAIKINKIIEKKPVTVWRNSDERKKKMCVQTILFFFQS